MKAFLFIVCLVLASTLSFPTSTIARELAEIGQNSGNPGNPVVNCGRAIPYSKCIPNPKPAPTKCTGYSRGCSDDPTP
ncbi:hypothetical protein V6N13_013142 [Hibiscus sabdariffa]|uniref:Uncharacterized protein n=1 Tax=Hibiscus sabdariffa TaxID=183260 RepID=A0ABR2SH36_9ROSI